MKARPLKARAPAARKPAEAPRLGVNTRKQAQGRRQLRRARRAGRVQRLAGLGRALAMTLAACGLLGGGAWAAYQAMEKNGMLALREVEVSGNRLWDRDELMQRAGLELGVQLPWVPVAKLEKALRALPGIGDAQVRRVFPSRLEIKVVEKAPVACGYARGWQGLSADGARLPGNRGADLPVVDGFASMDSLALVRVGGFLEETRRAHPSLYRGFSQVALRGNTLEIVLRNGRLKVLFDAEDGNLVSTKSLNSLEFLRALLHRQGAALEAGKTVDMRVEGYAYVR